MRTTGTRNGFRSKATAGFIVFIFAIVLPSPTVYFYRKDTGALGASGEASGDGFEENPLAIDVDNKSVAADDGDTSAESATAQPARAKLAKMQREAKDARSQVQKLQAQVQQLQAENQQQQMDNQAEVLSLIHI